MSKWEWKKLGEVCDSINGLWKGKKEPFIKVGVIRNTNFTKNCKLDLNPSKLEFLDVEKKQYDKRKLLFGDLIVEKSGGSEKQPVGRVVLFEEKEGEYSFSNFTSVLRIKNDDEIECHFLHLQLYKLYLDGVTKQMQSATTGIHNLDFDQFKDLSIGIPPLSEQKRIVKFLDEEFSKIETLKTNAETNLKNAKELFETTLEKELNPLSRHSERSEESSAELPSGWEWKTLGDVCEKISDGSHNPPKGTAANEYKMLSSKNIFNDCLNFDDPRFLTKEEFDLENKRTNVKKGDILLTIVGTIGRCCVFLEDEPVVFQRSVAVLKPNVSLVYSRFLMYGIIALNIEKLGRGAAQKGVYLKQLSNISIPLPPLSVQKEIVARLDKLSENVKRLEANYKQIIANCDELKKSILKKTFEGES